MFGQWPGVECASAGVHPSANTPLSPELIEWADIIFVMERIHRTRMAARFGALLHDKRVVVLGIPDRFEFLEPRLIELLKIKAGPYLGAAA